MKQGFLIYACATLLWLPLTMAAQRRGAAHAEAIASWHWQNSQVSSANGAASRYVARDMTLGREGMPCFVVTRETQDTGRPLPGFIVVPADEQMPRVLAYSDDAHFRTSDMPDRIRLWLEGYADMAAVGVDAPDALSRWLAASRQQQHDIQPLLGQRMWGQDSPYNLYCPDVNGEACPSGCVATALAQVMAYHGWPLTGTGNISYRTRTHGINVSYDFSAAAFQWQAMEDVYSPMAYSLDRRYTVERNKRFSVGYVALDEANSFAQCYVRIGALNILGASSFTGETALMLTDEADSLAARLSQTVELESWYSGQLLTGSTFPISVPSNLADGTYRIYCAVRSKGDLKWSLAFQQGGRTGDYLAIEKEGDVFHIGGITFPCSPDEQKADAIATLLQAAGAAVRMDYDPSGSGSYDSNVLSGLTSYLRYDSDMFFATPDAFSDHQWHQLLQTELQAGRPVYYTGQGNTSGHAFVIDGMQAADDGTTYYHVNWGWDGMCNGYYLLNMLRPSSTGTGGSSGSNYSTNPSMLIGMKPEDDVSNMLMACKSMAVKDTDVFPQQMVSLRIDKLAVLTSTDFKGSFAVVMRNTQDAMADAVTLYREEATTITARRGLTEYYLRCKVPADTPAGTYEVAVECEREDGTPIEILAEEWPTLKVRDASEWPGGDMTTPEQLVALRTATLSQADDPTLVTLTADSVLNLQQYGLQGRVALLVCDSLGRMVSAMAEPRLLILSSYGVRRNVSVTGRFSKYLPDGDYRLCVGYLSADNAKWTYASSMDHQGNIWWSSFPTFSMPMRVADGNATIGDFTFEGTDMSLSVPVVQMAEKSAARVYDLSGRQARDDGKHKVIIKDKRKLLWKR